MKQSVLGQAIDLVPAIEDCDVGVIQQRIRLRRLTLQLESSSTCIGEAWLLLYAGVKDYFSDESLLFFESGNSEESHEKSICVRPRQEANEIAERGQQIYYGHMEPGGKTLWAW